MVQNPAIGTWNDPSSLYTTSLTPLIVTGAMVQLLRAQFAEAQHLSESLQDNVWHSDFEQSKILIEWVHRFEPKTIGQRPALLIRRGQVAPQAVGIGHNHIQGGYLGPHGGEVWSKPRLATVTVFAIGRTGGEAEMLGVEAERHLDAFSDRIRCDLELLAFRLIGMDTISRLEEVDHHYVVPVNFLLAYMESHEVIPEAPLLKTLAVETKLNLLDTM